MKIHDEILRPHSNDLSMRRYLMELVRKTIMDNIDKSFKGDVTLYDKKIQENWFEYTVTVEVNNKGKTEKWHKFMVCVSKEQLLAYTINQLESNIKYLNWKDGW